jgi:Outer membrane efflux protein
MTSGAGTLPSAVDTAREEIDRQAAGHFPTLDLVGRHGFDTTGGRFGNVETDGKAIGVELAVPIFSGGAVVSQTREAAERHQQAIEQREQARRESYRQTRVAFLGVVAGISRIKALKQAGCSPAKSRWPLRRLGWRWARVRPWMSSSPSGRCSGRGATTHGRATITYWTRCV